MSFQVIESKIASLSSVISTAELNTSIYLHAFGKRILEARHTIASREWKDSYPAVHTIALRTWNSMTIFFRALTLGGKWPIGLLRAFRSRLGWTLGKFLFTVLYCPRFPERLLLVPRINCNERTGSNNTP